jgi:S1-C subfamily serine protease
MTRVTIASPLDVYMTWAWRLVIVVLLAVLCVNTGCAGRTGVYYSKDQQRQATVAIVTQCDEAGSGVIIDEHHILTAAHVFIDCPGRIMVSTHDGTVYEAMREMTDSIADVARLHVLETLPSPGMPATADARQHFMVCIQAGYPVPYRDCRLISQHGTKSTEFEYRINVTPGNSGSPLWSLDGALVGIHQCQYKDKRAACGIMLRTWMLGGVDE